MSQEQVARFLRRNRQKWYTGRQIAAELNVSVNSVYFSLRRMRKYHEVRERMVAVGLRRGLGNATADIKVTHFAHKRF